MTYSTHKCNHQPPYIYTFFFFTLLFCSFSHIRLVEVHSHVALFIMNVAHPCRRSQTSGSYRKSLSLPPPSPQQRRASVTERRTQPHRSPTHTHTHMVIVQQYHGVMVVGLVDSLKENQSQRQLILSK